MGLIFNKKGAELSVNVVVIAVLAILVLVVVAFILTGGASKFTDTVRKILNPAPGADDISFAVNECNILCATATDDEDYCGKRLTFKDPTEPDGDPITETCGDPDGILSQRVACGISCT